MGEQASVKGIRGGVTENKDYYISDDLQQLLGAIEKAVGEMVLNYFRFCHDTISFVEVYALSLYHNLAHSPKPSPSW